MFDTQTELVETFTTLNYIEDVQLDYGRKITDTCVRIHESLEDDARAKTFAPLGGSGTTGILEADSPQLYIWLRIVQ